MPNVFNIQESLKIHAQQTSATQEQSVVLFEPFLHEVFKESQLITNLQ